MPAAPVERRRGGEPAYYGRGADTRSLVPRECPLNRGAHYPPWHPVSTYVAARRRYRAPRRPAHVGQSRRRRGTPGGQPPGPPWPPRETTLTRADRSDTWHRLRLPASTYPRYQASSPLHLNGGGARCRLPPTGARPCARCSRRNALTSETKPLRACCGCTTSAPAFGGRGLRPF